MIELYYMPSPNTWKVSIMLEECGLPYTVKQVNIGKGEQNEPAYLAINPNSKIPAIIDLEGPDGRLPIFESGAILVYLADKSGKFLPPSGNGRYNVLQWLFWQMAGLGPMAGQAHVFRSARDPIHFAILRYTTECERLYGVLDKQLAAQEYICGDFSIADISCFGWVWFHNMHGQDLADFPNVDRWFNLMSNREGVRRGRELGIEMVPEHLQASLRGREFRLKIDSDGERLNQQLDNETLPEDMRLALRRGK